MNESEMKAEIERLNKALGGAWKVVKARQREIGELKKRIREADGIIRDLTFGETVWEDGAYRER